MSCGRLSTGGCGILSLDRCAGERGIMSPCGCDSSSFGGCDGGHDHWSFGGCGTFLSSVPPIEHTKGRVLSINGQDPESEVLACPSI